MLAVVAILVAVGCAGPQSPAPGPGVEPERSAPVAPKRITISMRGDPSTLYLADSSPRTVPGMAELGKLVNAGLAIEDGDGRLRAHLAEALPSLDNGLWKVLPDGRMETTWRIRPGASWHDGTPFTAADLVFTATVSQDRDTPIFAHSAYKLIEGVDAPDPRTVTVRWSKPYIDADAMFASEFSLALPKHLLESSYLENKATFTQLPYWMEEFVGNGPYRLRELARSSHAILEANPLYALGRPKIDVIEVKFIPDSNATIANVLAGAMDLTLGRGLSLEESIEVRNQWKDGRLEVALSNWQVLTPQFINPSPAVLANLQFRRALLYALDRQEMASSLQDGLTPVAHTFINPDHPDWKEAIADVMRYEYNPNRAIDLIGGLGYTRGADGIFRDGAGQRLSVEIRSSAGDLGTKAMVTVADYWQRAGVGVDQVIGPAQRRNDREYLLTQPAFRIHGGGSGPPRAVANLHSSQIPLPENNFVGQNRSRYRSEELDGLIDRYFATIPKAERIQALAQIVRHIAEQLPLLGLFWDTEPTLLSNRLANVTARTQGATPWNVQEWDIR